MSNWTLQKARIASRIAAAFVLASGLGACSVQPTTRGTDEEFVRQKACDFRSRNETAMRGTSGMRAYDAFDIYFSCIRERSQALNTFKASERS